MVAREHRYAVNEGSKSDRHSRTGAGVIEQHISKPTAYLHRRVDSNYL